MLINGNRYTSIYNCCSTTDMVIVKGFEKDLNQIRLINCKGDSKYVLHREYERIYDFFLILFLTLGRIRGRTEVEPIVVKIRFYQKSIRVASEQTGFDQSHSALGTRIITDPFRQECRYGQNRNFIIAREGFRSLITQLSFTNTSIILSCSIWLVISRQFQTLMVGCSVNLAMRVQYYEQLIRLALGACLILTLIRLLRGVNRYG